MKSLSFLTLSIFAMGALQPLPTPANAQDGEIVAERSYFGFTEPWLVWDEASCSFKPTDTHPTTYTGQLRKVGTGGPRIVYTTADTTLPVMKTINGSFEKYAGQSGADMTMLSNEYPSKTKPILLAKQVAAMNPDVVISNFWIPELYPQVGKTYLEACVPFLNMHAFKIDFVVPGFQNSYPATGIALADGVIKLVREKNWPIEETWLMVCGTPDHCQG